MSDDDGRRAFAEAMRRLQETSRLAEVALRRFEVAIALLCNEDLRDWNDEMDNCYPNIEWPDP